MRNIFLDSGVILEILEIVPMSSETFGKEIEERGWNPELLGVRWGLSKRRIQQIIADVDRPRYYDDAVMNLPILIKK